MKFTSFKSRPALVAALVIGVSPLAFSQEKPADKKDQKAKTEKIAYEQDELSADLQELMEDQTVEEVIALLEEVEDAMNDATDRLVRNDTGGEAIAAQTEVIEKIFQAAKKKSESRKQQQQQQQQQQGQQGQKGQQGQQGQGQGEGQGQGQGQGEGEGQGQGQGEGEGQGQGQGKNPGDERMDAMLEMMKKMMGDDDQGEQQELPSGDGEGEGDGKGGEGQDGSSDTPSEEFGGDNDGAGSERRVPKKSGIGSDALPREFRKAIDAYNKSLRNGQKKR